MVKKKDIGLVMGISEREKKASPDLVEGTEQCGSCDHYMSLGKGHLCTAAPGSDQGIFEIVCWVPGSCERYLESASPFKEGE